MKHTVLGLCLIAGVLAACSEVPPPVQAPRAVLVRTIATGEGAAGISVYSGEVRARHEADLSFRIGGKVTERLVDVGDRIRVGQVLARIDPRDLALGAQAATAQQSAAEADAALARAELARVESLHARNFVSASALDSRRASLQAAEARLRQARALLAVAGNQTGYAELRSDRDGVVTAVPVEAGQVVSAGQAVVRAARGEGREILIHVPEARIATLRTAQAARVRMWANPQRDYPARVREIAPAADAATRSFAVRVALDEGGDALPLGATANVVLASPLAAQAVVPLAAVTRGEGASAVWVVDAESRVRRIGVETGEYREDGVVIRDGLPEGARVVVAGVHRLVEGEAVRPIDPSAPVAVDARK